MKEVFFKPMRLRGAACGLVIVAAGCRPRTTAAPRPDAAPSLAPSQTPSLAPSLAPSLLPTRARALSPRPGRLVFTPRPVFRVEGDTPIEICRTRACEQPEQLIPIGNR